MNISDENNVIFEPIKLDPNYEFKLSKNIKEIFVPVEPGINLHGFFFTNLNSNNLLIYFQGNAKNLQNWLDAHSMAMEWNQSILVVDYRGFGKSEGVLNGQEQMYEDADKIYAFAKSQGYEDDQLVFYGYSMGSAMATYLASKVKAKGVILESPYSSIPEITWVGDKTPSYQLNNKEYAKSVDIPTLIIHGDLDDVITPDHSQRIFDNVKTPQKDLFIIKGGSHGDFRSREDFRGLILKFLTSI